MSDKVVIGRPLHIRERGFDEYWLQDQIVANPGCLGLGELEVISRERQQSTGGRLDILLKDPEDDSMYEVEVMLGETDESHIIRTIEYWDNEKRKWPKRQHVAVLVAESITRRFFNVIQLLSHAVPIIAIQANLLEANGQVLLHFVKVLDTYEEPEEEGSSSYEVHDEAFWRAKAAWTVDVAKALEEILVPVFGTGALKYVKNYIAFTVEEENYFSLHKRASNKSLLSFWLPDDLLVQASALLDERGISHVKKTDSIRLTIDEQLLKKNAEPIRAIALLVKQGWER